MKKTRHTEEQIACALKQAETGTAVSELILHSLDEQIVSAGMVADWARHAHADADGRWVKKSHVHLVITSRFRKARAKDSRNPPGSRPLNITAPSQTLGRRRLSRRATCRTSFS